MVWAKVAFGVTLSLALIAGFMTLYAREVRRDRDATLVFMIMGVASMVATVAIGWWWL